MPFDAFALRPGDTVEIRGLHADGIAYRWWPATVEKTSADEIALIWPAGTPMEAPEPAKRTVFRRNCRSIFWRDRMYFITEAYELGGELGTVFADIATLTCIAQGRLEYTDHELDVVRIGGVPVVEDEDEFQDAAANYGYSEAFQQRCREALAEALHLVGRWVPRGDVRVARAAKGEQRA
jgi:protein associated with RNAse G/E